MSRRLSEGRLLLATHNAGKAREVAALLAGHGIEVVTAGESPERSADHIEDFLRSRRADELAWMSSGPSGLR